MAIISANRYSRVNGNFVIAANESYGVEDMGRILIENERNDMAIFNAILKNDMYELKCRTEGTLLESELQALSENAVKDLFNSIIEKLKKFWAKMKGFFQKAYAMITAYCVRNGKAFLTANKKALSELSDNTTVPGKVFVPENRYFESSAGSGSAAQVLENFKKNTNSENSKSEMTKAVLKSLNSVMADYDGEKTVAAYLKDKLFSEMTDKTLKECGGKLALMGDLDKGIKAVKTLKENEKKIEKEVKGLIKDLENKARSAAKGMEDGEEKTAKAKEADYYRTGSTAVTNAMSTYIRAMVKMVKFRLSQDRIILAKAIGKQAHVESTLLESMILEAQEDLESLDDDTAADLTPEEEEIVDAIVAAAEEKLAEDDGEEIEADEGCK